MEPAPPDVLLVEDDLDLREIVSLLLEAAGLSVVAAAEAKSAIAHLKNQRPKVLITDYKMPGPLLGLDLAREARRLYPDLPILAFSGQDDLDVLRAAGLFILVAEKSQGYAKVIEVARSLVQGA